MYKRKKTDKQKHKPEKMVKYLNELLTSEIHFIWNKSDAQYYIGFRCIT